MLTEQLHEIVWIFAKKAPMMVQKQLKKHETDTCVYVDNSVEIGDILKNEFQKPHKSAMLVYLWNNVKRVMDFGTRTGVVNRIM